ncbi:MAG: flagellar motor switch protein FliG [Rubricoccaceae bacterium]
MNAPPDLAPPPTAAPAAASTASGTAAGRAAAGSAAAGTAWISRPAQMAPRASGDSGEPGGGAPVLVVAEPPSPAEVLARMSGVRRSAVLLIALGLETASKVLPLLSDADVEAVSVEIARTRNVPSEQVEAVLCEYHDLSIARGYVGQGGADFARKMLTEALGEDRAEEIMMKVEAAIEVSAFHLLHTVAAEPLVAFLEGEHPQTSALILTQLNPRKAAELIARLPPEMQAEVVYRIATMGTPAPEAVRAVEEVIRAYIGGSTAAEGHARGGVAKVAEILSAVTRSTERALMDALRERSQELAGAVKNLMFVFDDLVRVDARDLQRILMAVDQRDLALALRGAPEALSEKVFANVSERVASALREEIELLENVSVAEVDEAQARVLAAALELEAGGEVALSRKG